VFHETLNLGGLWKLPLIPVCEANGLTVRTSTEDQIAARPIAGLARKRSAHAAPVGNGLD
jgi:TPP-dependent pyruvate/acetoin dehydrogenase alpha subunit